MSGSGKVWYAVVELAAPDYLPLHNPGFDPHPLALLQHVAETLDHEKGERVQIAV